LENAKEALSEYSQLIIEMNPESFESPKAYRKAYLDKIRTLAISSYNVGCQEEHFGRWKQALRAYEKSANLTEKSFKAGDQLTLRFRKDYDNFKKRMMEHGFNASRDGSVISEKSSKTFLPDKLKGRASSRNNSMHKASSTVKKRVRPTSATSNRSNQSRTVPEWKFKDSPYDHAPKNNDDRHRACIPNKPFGARTVEKGKTPPSMIQQKNDWNVTRKIQPSTKTNTSHNNNPNKPRFDDYKMSKNNADPTLGGIYIHDTGHHGAGPYYQGQEPAGKVNFQTPFNNFMGADSDDGGEMGGRQGYAGGNRNPGHTPTGNRGGGQNGPQSFAAMNPNAGHTTMPNRGGGMGVIGMNNKSAKDLNYIEKLKGNEMLTFVSDEGEDDEYFNNTVKTKQNNAGDYKRKMENTLQHLKGFQK
jgi:hypothetical protein